ncbi:hypothetical protein Hanom_Chr17g01529181 [Helianthus anomalus]
MLPIVAEWELDGRGSRVPTSIPVNLIGRFCRRNGKLEGDLEQPQPQRLESCFCDSSAMHHIFLCHLI